MRIELGPREIQNKEFVTVRRDNGAKSVLKLEDSVTSMKALLEDIHSSMFAK